MAQNKNMDVRESALRVLKEVFKETRRIRFEGNGYSESWEETGTRLGLPNAKNTPAALPSYLTKDAIELMERTHVLTEREVKAKVDIKLETYVKTKEIEYKTATNIARTLILPALTKQISLSATAAANMKNAGCPSEILIEEVKTFENLYLRIKEKTNELEDIISTSQNDLFSKAKFFADKAEKALEALRIYVDNAEELIADEFWPMAKYQDLLTIL